MRPCISWHRRVKSVSGNRSCHRKTRLTDNVHSIADANIMLLCAITRDFWIRLTCVAPIASTMKCPDVRKAPDTIVTRRPSQNEPNMTLMLFLLCYLALNFIYLGPTTMEVRSRPKSFEFQDDRCNISVPLAMSTNLHLKKCSNYCLKTKGIIRGLTLGQGRPEKNSPKC